MLQCVTLTAVTCVTCMSCTAVLPTGPQGPRGPPGMMCEQKVRSSLSHTCPILQMLDGEKSPCNPFDCTCSASVKCPAGKKVSACYCYNSNPRTKTEDPAYLEKYPGGKPPASHKGSFPWMLTSVIGFDGIPGDVGEDGTCSCSWVNTMLLVSLHRHSARHCYPPALYNEVLKPSSALCLLLC